MAVPEIPNGGDSLCAMCGMPWWRCRCRGEGFAALERTIGQVRARFADLSPAELTALINEASAGVRLEGLRIRDLVREGRQE